ncbi:MAG TPA: hypothetical protein VK970_20765, partial [Candidatus Methylacidiphilales bacterium]|nr:hypothetical protein [Candidatus Methylacidiphilales bacterium]
VDVTDNRHFQTDEPTGMWRGDSVQCIIDDRLKGAVEFGFAEDKEGKPVAMVWTQPEGSEDFRSRIRVTIEKRGEGRIYTARVPLKDLGLSQSVLRSGFRFNIAVNDSDGTVRAHAMQLAPGLVESKSLEAFPYVLFKPAAEGESP